MDTAGSILSRVEMSEGTLHYGLAYDGQNLWHDESHFFSFILDTFYNYEYFSEISRIAHAKAGGNGTEAVQKRRLSWQKQDSSSGSASHFLQPQPQLTLNPSAQHFPSPELPANK
jgi:hypothetical protein